MGAVKASVDRASLIRRAMVELVAEKGLGGASMAAIAERAGVAAGTAYVHYGSKADLLLATYAEQKAALGSVAANQVQADDPFELFRQIWLGFYDYLVSDVVVAQFMLQVDSSPVGRQIHDAAAEAGGDELVTATAILLEFTVSLPPSVLYDLALGPAIRLAASEDRLDEQSLELVIAGCWRAVTDF